MSGPIFVVGAPRSGTSLLRAMLNRHPAIALCDESFFFYYVYNRRGVFGDPEERDARERIVDAYLAIYRIRRLGLDLDRLRARLLAEGTSYPALFEALMRSYAEQRGARRFGEKTPQHALEVKRLLAWYPEARVIHLIRDPRGVVASLQRVHWASNSVTVNARLWRAHLRAVRAAEPSDRILTILYRDLVREPEQSSRTLCEFVGESYHPQMLESEPAQQADFYWFDGIYNAPTASRIGGWRDTLSSVECGLLEWLLREEMAALGYPAMAQRPGALRRQWACGVERAVRVRERMPQLPAALIRQLWPTRLADEERLIDEARTNRGVRHDG